MARFLKKMLDMYANELVSPNLADRRAHFADREAILKHAYANMAALKSARASGVPVASVAAGPGRVKQLVAFHEQQIQNVGAIDRQGQLIVYFRQWLFRQGAQLAPDGSIIWSKSTAVLKYDSELAQQALTKISIRNGLLYNARGELLDTSKMVTAASGPGCCIYVMSAENHIHVSSHAVGARHHSSLLAGQHVACAGEMKVWRGRLLALSNKSGHYQPEPWYMPQVIRVLAQQGVSEESYAVVEVTADNKVTHRTAREFMALQVSPVLVKEGQLVENPRYAAKRAESIYGSYTTGSVLAEVSAPTGSAAPAAPVYGAYVSAGNQIPSKPAPKYGSYF